MMTDLELLAQHRNGSESAFADLVRRHLDWVYSLARRRLRDAHLAEDVAQAVFVVLHRKAPQFAGDGAMINWLYRTAWYTSESAARSQRRRASHETQYAIERPEAVDPAQPPEWKELAPVLDKLIGQLSSPDREAILLRYYRDLSPAEIAMEMGTTPEAARKRTERAVERLRQMAQRQGIAMSSVSLTAGLMQFVHLPAPPGLDATSTVVATAPVGSAMAASSASMVKGGLAMMASTKITAISLTTAAIILTVATISAAYWVFNSISSVPVPASAIATTNPSTPTVAAPLRAPVLSPVPAVQPAFDATDRYPKLAPFTSVRWRGDVPEVQIANKTWYELVAVNAVPVAQVIDMQRGRDPQWRKHFAEDLVETFGRMNHALARTVDLQVRTLDANKTLLTLSGVPMTAANRDAVMMDEPINPKALFLFLRWVGDMPQVKIRVTWYELLGVEDLTTAKLIDQAKAAYGDQWQDQFQACLVNDLVKENLGPLMTATAKLRTLDTDQQVTIDMLMPLQPAR